MSDDERKALFDNWAQRYDHTVAATDGFPFAGYQAVLDTVLTLAAPTSGMRVLDVGCGTGALTQRLSNAGCAVLGVDFSERMLQAAAAGVPAATFRQMDLLGTWEALQGQTFDRIVSSYVLHEFDDPTKVDLLQRLTASHLAPDGVALIGDIAFPERTIHDTCHQQWWRVWDTSEHYWVADEMIEALAAAGIAGDYRQVSSCAGVFRLRSAAARSTG